MLEIFSRVDEFSLDNTCRCYRLFLLCLEDNSGMRSNSLETMKDVHYVQVWCNLIDNARGVSPEQLFPPLLLCNRYNTT